MLEVVLRLASAMMLIVLVAAGCGGSTRPPSSATPGLPPMLAQHWAAQASAIAHAAAGGDSCDASQLAGSLRAQVIADRARVPTRLRTVLLESVNSLANRIVCVPRQTVTQPTQPPPPNEHGHDHQDQGQGKGNGNGNGND
jgi:hypothetical protein